MKILILGATATGKTTLAGKISSKYSTKHYPLDELFFRFDNQGNLIKKLDDKERQQVIEEMVFEESWVVEGVVPFEILLEESDKIIYINAPLTVSLIRQWKRFFKDKSQRKKWGFLNNLKLTHYLLKQHLWIAESESSGGVRVDKKHALGLLEKYEKKVVYLEDNNMTKDLERILENLWVSGEGFEAP